MTPRSAAYESLLICEKDSCYSNIAVDNAIKNSSFDKRDASLYTMLVYGVISKKITLDHYISSMTGKNVKRLDKPVLILLRLGIFQIKYCDKIPDSAAVSETVKLAQRYASRAKGFINAVLRKSVDFSLSFDNLDEIKKLSVKYSVSEDICAILLRDYKENAEKILSSFDDHSKITIAVNPLKYTVEKALCDFEGAQKGKYSSLSVKLSDHAPSQSEEFKNGLFTIQDESSQIAIEALGPKPGMTLIDVCSCPGGKSFYSAFKMNDSGTIYSFDIHENKLSLIESGAQRLGISIIKTKENDARNHIEELSEKADRLICDVPCSGIGVIGKKPDIRYKNSDEIDLLPDLQYEILSESSKYLKKGGILIYSTCTLNKKENEAVAARFASSHPEFERSDFEVGILKSENGMITLIPYLHNTDGFFVARFIKK